MQGAIRSKSVFKLGDSLTRPNFFSSFHSTTVCSAKLKINWSATKNEGCNQQATKPSIRYSVRQKQSNAKSALNNILNGKPSNQYIKGGKLAWGAEEITSRRKDSSRSHSKNSKRSKGNHNGSKHWYNKKSSIYDEDGYEQLEINTSGHKNYTWSFGSWENDKFESSCTGFEWREDPKWEKAKQRVWRESDAEDDDSADVVKDLRSHRIALGLPPAGSLELDQVKHAFHASALKWHPDRHQGPSQAIAGERFKLCVDAYKSICSAFKST